MGDDFSTLEEREFEQLLGQDDDDGDDDALWSTPRQRLEVARAMADGVQVDGCDGSRDYCDEPVEDEAAKHYADYGGSWSPTEGCGDGVEEEATHLLQRLSRTLADSGEWERFHDISRESQDTLAEMNATLGSLRQWQKQRISAPATPDLGEASSARNSFKAYETPHEETTMHGSSSVEENDGFGCCHKPRPRALDGSNVNEENALAAICKEQHIRAQEAARRLREHLGPASRPCDISRPAETGTPDKPKDSVHELDQYREGEGQDRVVDLHRDIENLEMQRLIANVRAQACDHAATTASEACEEIWRGTESVGEMEGELACFTKDLDSLLLKLDCEDDSSSGRHHGGSNGFGDAVVVVQGGDVRAPAADTHIGCAQ